MKAVPRRGTPNGRAALEAEQIAKLRALLTAIVPANAFYTAKLRDFGEITSLEDFTRLVPCTTKIELIEDQKAHPPYGSNLTFPLERYTRFSQTSGTSAEPLRWLDTPESWEWMLGNWQASISRGWRERRRPRFFRVFVWAVSWVLDIV